MDYPQALWPGGRTPRGGRRHAASIWAWRGTPAKHGAVRWRRPPGPSIDAAAGDAVVGAVTPRGRQPARPHAATPTRAALPRSPAIYIEPSPPEGATPRRPAPPEPACCLLPTACLLPAPPPRDPLRLQYGECLRGLMVATFARLSERDPRRVRSASPRCDLGFRAIRTVNSVETAFFFRSEHKINAHIYNRPYLRPRQPNRPL